MDSTRVAMLVPAPLEMVAGGHIYDHRIAAGLRAAGCQVTMAAVAGRHPLPDAAAEASAQAIWAALPDDAIPVIDGSALPAFAPLGEALARRAVGLIHHPVSMETGLSTEDAGFLGAIERRMLPALRRIVVTSPETASTLTAAFGVEAARVSVVMPGTEAAPRSVGSGGPGCAILSIGTLLPRKGHEVLLRALARLFDLDWHLTIAGEARDRRYAAMLRALVEELGLGRRVGFVGVMLGAPLEALWLGADVFALATQYEGYGMAIAEALKRGLPVAVTASANAGGAAGALVTPEAGAVCEVGDVAQLSKALRHLIFDVALRRDMAAAAWAVGQGLPDWATQARMFAGVLRG